MNINHPDSNLTASGGDDTSVTDSVQGTETKSEEATVQDKARYKDAKHDGMEKA